MMSGVVYIISCKERGDEYGDETSRLFVLGLKYTSAVRISLALTEPILRLRSQSFRKIFKLLCAKLSARSGFMARILKMNHIDECLSITQENDRT